MNESDELQNNEYSNAPIFAFVVSTLATVGMIRRGGYSAALLFYRHQGGGFNVYKKQPDGKSHRIFAIDYHPFWNKAAHCNEWTLHYHRGKTYSELKKHRPYEGW